MKNYIKYLGLALPLVLAFGTSGCQDDFDTPNLDSIDKTATIEANTSILELKTMYWNDDTDVTDYAEEVSTFNADLGAKLTAAGLSIGDKAEGDHIIIKGRVVSSDYSGNIYKTLVLQDESAAITIGIDATSLYGKFPMGQEVVIDATGLYIGKYCGLMQLGIAQDGGVNRMPFQLFMLHAQRNGSAYVTDADGVTRMHPVDTALVTISDINSYIGTPESTRKWQSRLVRFNNVAFQGGGELTFAEKESTAQRFIQDSYGNSLMVYNSGYSSFWSETLPAGNGDVVGILSYYQTSGWQLLLNDTDGCMNFGNPTFELGTRENPYTIENAIEFEVNDMNMRGWVTGYIVGAVAPGIDDNTPISGNDDIEWGAPSSMKNTLVIAPSPDVKEVSQCLVFSLPENSVLRKYANLVDNPDIINRQMWILGNFTKYFGAYGLSGNNGTADEFAIDGVDLPGGSVTDGDGSETNPYTVAQIKAMNPTSTTEAVKSNVWAKGFIVGYYADYDAHFMTPTESKNAANILISDVANPSDKSQCVCIQLLYNTEPRTKLNLFDNPSNLGKMVAVYGDVMKYNSLPGIKNTSNYILDGQTGGDTPDPSGQLFSETFASDMGKFFIHNVKLSPSLSYVWAHDSNYGYMKASAFLNQSYESDAWLISPVFDLSAAISPVLSFEHVINKFPSVEVAREQVSLAVSVDGADWQTLSVPTWSDNSNWKFVNSGDIDLSAYTGKKIQIGFHYTSTDAASGSWEIKNLVINGSGSLTVQETTNVPGGGSTGGDDKPIDPTGEHQADFNTFNGGAPKSSYGTYSTTSGWTAVNAAIQSGSDGTGDSNPKFDFLGASTTFAVCLNGNTSKVGVLTSPALTGGLSKVTLNYGFAFGDTKCKFTVNIKQNGATVQTKTVEETLAKFDVHSFTWDVNVTGDFVIEIVNDCPSNAASNKDRVSIWDLKWTN